MTVKSAPAKGRRGGGARAGLGQGIGGASGGQVVKEGPPELKKVRPNITQVVKKKMPNPMSKNQIPPRKYPTTRCN